MGAISGGDGGGVSIATIRAGGEDREEEGGREGKEKKFHGAVRVRCHRSAHKRAPLPAESGSAGRGRLGGEGGEGLDDAGAERGAFEGNEVGDGQAGREVPGDEGAEVVAGAARATRVIR
jgi:hypothetical protein